MASNPEQTKEPSFFSYIEGRIKKKSVSFTDVMLLYAMEKGIHSDQYSRLVEAFERVHGGIVSLYQGPPSKNVCGSVLTSRGEIFDVAPPPAPDKVELFTVMWDCEQLAHEVNSYTRGRSRKVLLKRIHEIITNVMYLLERRNETPVK